MNIEWSNITLFWLPNGNASGVATASLSDTASVLIIACDRHLFLFHIVVHDLLAFQTSSLAGQNLPSESLACETTCTRHRIFADLVVHL